VTALSVNLQNTTIVAPITGVATTKPASVGDIVAPAQTDGSSLVELVDFDTLLVETDVPEGRLGAVKKGGPCEVVLDAFADKRFRGEVVEVTPKLNRSKATATVKVKLVDEASGVLPEMAARVSFLAKALGEAELKEAPKTVLPAAAVAERGGGKVVFVVDNGKVRMQTVALGPPFGGGFEIKDGLQPGTHLVKDPPSSLADGQSIKERND
jgi:RND family efflux transporter MFP subunit